MKKRFIIILLILTLSRLMVSLFMGISEDEAYYWTWSKHPQASYFDHPPAIAWLIKLSTTVFGDTAPAVHSVALVCMTLFLVFFYLWLKEMFDAAIAETAALLAGITPVFFIGGLIALPDCPMLLFWCLSLFSIFRALKHEKTLYFYAAGLFMGLSSISKYTGLLLPLILFGYLAVSGKHRKWLLRKEPYFSVLIALAVFSPVILWNLQNGWASFSYQFLSRQRATPSLSKLLLFTGTQALYVSPITFILLIFGFVKLASEGFLKRRWEYVFLFVSSCPVFLLFAFNSAFSSKFGPHWPAAGYIGGLAAIAVFYKNKTVNRSNIAITAIIISLVSAQILYPVLPVSEKDMTSDLYGWDALGVEVGSILAAASEKPFLLADRYQAGAQLAFAAKKDVYVKRRNRITAFDFWQDINSMAGRDALYFTTSRYFREPEVFYLFNEKKLVREIPVLRAGRKVRTFYLYHLKDFKGLN